MKQQFLFGTIRPMKRLGLAWLAPLALAMVVNGCSKREGTPSSEEPAARAGAVGTGGAGANLKNDDDFVRDVALKNMAEIELSRIALDKSPSPQVKAFARMMIDAHGAAGDQLKSLISDQRIEWPAQLDENNRKTANELDRKQGTDFDRDYLNAMVEGHQDFAAKLESRLDVQSLTDWKTAAAGRTDDHALPDPKSALSDVPVRPDKSHREITTKINQWAAATYPVAQKHLDAARTLANIAKKRSTH